MVWSKNEIMFNQKEYQKQYYKNNQKKMREQNKQYYQDHKDEINKRSKEWHENNPEKVKESAQKWRKDNREQINEREKSEYKKKKQFINNYKLSKGCSICGYNKCAAALDFHHEGDNKKFSIGEAPSNHIDLERIKKEMDKCNVMCCCCHRELHDKERKRNEEKKRVAHRAYRGIFRR